MIEEKFLNQKPLKKFQLEESKSDINKQIKEAQARKCIFDGNVSRK